MSGLSTTGSISLGLALVAGKKRVPRPATGNTAVRMGDFKLIKPSSDWKKSSPDDFFDTAPRFRRQKAWFLPPALARGYARTHPDGGRKCKAADGRALDSKRWA